MAIIFCIRHTLDSQTLLRNVGPMIPAFWGKTAVNGSTSSRIQTSEQIRGNMLLDTGARHIAIDESVAQQLELQARPVKRETCMALGVNNPLRFTTELFFSPWSWCGPSRRHLLDRRL
jgi:hypothetical protein